MQPCKAKRFDTFAVDLMVNSTFLALLTLFLLGLSLCSSTFDGSETLSPRSVNTKYGSLRGILVHFKTYDRSSVTSGSKSSSSSASASSSSSSSIPKSSTSQLKRVEVFLGVPYATPPIGSLRFMPPVTPAHWRGVKLANRVGPVCPQKIPDTNLWPDNYRNHSSSKTGRGSESQLPEGRVAYLKRIIPFLRNQSEDCLYLNIYTPFTSGQPSTRVPVMVFIHGESYEWGAGNPYDGTILSSFGNVIIVTVNYRLGIFGFLPAFVDGSIRGNYGLMDQVAALHWIQENIAEFGGDSYNVTIIGHGYGAACVNLLMISPMASNLFTRVILMSGSALSPWALALDAETYARNLAKVLNCPNFDNVIMVDCLRSKSVDEILRVDLKVPQHLTSFGPIVDGIVVPSEPKVLIKKALEQSSSTSSSASSFSSPSSLYSVPVTFDRSGHAPSVASYDLLFGITRVETPFVFTGYEEKHGIDLSRRDRILRTLVRNLFDYHQQVIFLTLINEYTDWSRPIEHPINLFDSLVDILGDALIVSPLIQTGDCNTRLAMPSMSSSSVRRHHHLQQSAQRSQSSSQSSQGRVTDSGLRSFFYVFSYQSENSGFTQRLGCHHGEELSYVFGAPLAADLLGRSIGHFSINSSKQEITLSEAVMTYWTNFVKFGDPNIWPHELDSLGDRAKGRFENVYWPQYDTTQRKYLMIAMKPKVRDHYHSHRLSYWLQLVPKLQQQPDNEEQLYYYKHHLLPDHENPDTYDGVVRQISFRFLSSAIATPSATVYSNVTSGHSQNGVKSDFASPFRTSAASSNQAVSSVKNQTSSTPPPKQDDTASVVTSATDTGSPPQANKTQATPIVMEPSSYSTALSVTIAIGCSLLILNILIFAGVYYQLDKAKATKGVGKGQQQQQQQPTYEASTCNHEDHFHDEQHYHDKHFHEKHFHEKHFHDDHYHDDHFHEVISAL